MARRRTFGNVRKLPSGRWQATYLDPLTRARVPGPTTFVSKADANRWLSSIEVDLHRGDDLDPAGRSLTFGRYAETWLAGKAALRPKTRDLYTYLLRRHLLPTFGSASSILITPAAAREWHAGCGRARPAR
jgi:hypothetical protein